MKNFKHAVTTTLISSCILCPAVLAAEETDRGNTLGIQYIYTDNPNGKFGEYNGLDENHSNIILNLDLLNRNENAPEQYWDVEVHNLGLDTFFINGEYAEQGNFRVRAGFDQLQKIYHEDAQTLYDNDLNTLLNPRKKTTETQRETASAGFDKFFTSMWELKTDFKSQSKEGDRPRPLNGGLIVAQDIDFQHDELDASLTYTGEKLQMVFASYVSMFENDNDRLDIDNNLSSVTAAEPDNNFYQVSANGGYTINNASRATGYISYSKAEQDENFNDYGIANGTYSTNNLDAEYETMNMQLGYRNKLTQKLNIDVSYKKEDRDNNTKLYSFPSDKNNKVYEWDKQEIEIKARYRLPARWRLNGGFELSDDDYEVSKNPRAGGSRLTELAANMKDNVEEETAWAEIRTPMLGNFYGSLKYSHGDRDVDLDSARKGAATTDTNGVALSTYLLERKRDKVDMLLSQSLTDTTNISFMASMIEDDYDGIAWSSLDQSDSDVYTLDFTYTPHRDYSLNIYTGMENFDVEQSGFSTLGDPTTSWAYEIEDSSNFIGFTARSDNLYGGTVDLSIDYRYQKGEGEYTTVDTGDFPDLDTTINRVTLQADIHYPTGLTLNASFIYEHYESDSWVWRNDDFNDPDGYTNVLNYGYDSPNYITRSFVVGATYPF